MKNTFTSIIAAAFLFSCHAHSDKNTTKDSTTTDHEVGVQNVNGNIPDTTNAIDLTHKLDTISNKKIDTTK